jgi:DNA-binding CsgD family transcriptional regulator
MLPENCDRRHPQKLGGFAVDIEEAIAAIESSDAHKALEATLQDIVGSYGFASYCFLDIGHAYLDVPFYVGTTGPEWESEYESNGFVHVDECIRLARRTNRPFSWTNVSLPKRTGKRKPGALKVMEAATDHGFEEGLDIPFHYVDSLGRMHSSNCVLMWRDKPRDFYAVRSFAEPALHLILIYWMQRSIELRERAQRSDRVLGMGRARAQAHQMQLTDKEREVMAWAARGKTAEDSAEIMSISTETVRWHTKNAIDKLGAGNKTHAVAKAIHLGLIDF